MAQEIQVAGATLVQVGTGTLGALQNFGYTRDGVTIRIDGYFLDVHVDNAGGEAGPPADVQWLGQTAMVSLEMTKWDAEVADKLVNRVFGATTPGNTAAYNLGSLMVGGGNLYMGTSCFVHRLCLQSTINLTAFNFPYAFFREAIEINRGTKYSTLRLEAFALPVNGVLYNTSTG